MFAYIATTFKKNNPKNLVLAFDIPEAERGKEELVKKSIKNFWVRNVAKKFMVRIWTITKIIYRTP